MEVRVVRRRERPNRRRFRKLDGNLFILF